MNLTSRPEAPETMVANTSVRFARSAWCCRPWTSFRRRWGVLGCLLIVALMSPHGNAQTIQYSYDSLQRLTRVQYADGSAVDYVYDNVGNRLAKTTSAPNSLPDNPPGAVIAPGIANGAVNVSSTPLLSWPAATDPDSSDSVMYFVYFGTTPTPPLAYSGWQTNWSPGQVQCLTTYYWQVVTRDNHNAESTGPLWSFTTGDIPPLPDFMATPASGLAPLTVGFQDQSQYHCGTLVSWQWDFKNTGQVQATTPNPTFTYTAPGDYTVKLTVGDEHGGLETVVKTNYISVLGPNIVDLVPVDLKIESAGPFGNLVVSYAATNTGSISVSGKWQWADWFYLSSTQVPDENASPIVSFVESQALPAGSWYRRTNLVPVLNLNTAVGQYLCLNVDGGNQLQEISTNNNVLAVPLRLPDLVPGGLNWSGQAIAGQFITATYGVTNRGTLDIRGPGGSDVEFYDTFYLSSNATWDATATLVSGAYFSGALPTGAGYKQTVSFYLPSWPPGQYWLLLRANDYGVIAESDQSNNTLAIAISLSAPDLTPLSIKAPQGVASDARIDIVYSVTNQGNAAALGVWMDSLYLSTNTAWSQTAYSLGSFFEIGPVGTNGTYAATNSVRLPGWPAGTYYLILDVNSQQYLSETVATNNFLAVPLVLTTPGGLPDLSPVSLSAPPVGTAGQAIRVSYTVTNLGSLTATGAWSDWFWISSNPVWDQTADNLGAASVMGPIPAHGSYARTNTVTLPLLDPGTYYLFVQVNGYDLLYESATTNNIYSVSIQVEGNVGLADLVPMSLNAPSSAAPRQTISLTYTAGNTGPVPAAGSWMDIIWLSTNAFYDDSATLLAYSMLTGPVASGSNYVRTLNATLPPVAPGIYYLIVQVDMTRQVYEADYDNNTLAMPIVLQGQAALPDLAPLSLTAPSSAVSGQTITASYAVTNCGAGIALGFWFDKWALSTNAVWSSAAYLLALQPRTQAVAVAGSYRATNNLPLPSWPAGNYYLLLNVNALSNLTESAETNNLLWAPITLTAPSLPPSLGAVGFLSDHHFRLALTGALGTNYTLQASTNLVQWQPVYSLVMTNSPTYFTDYYAPFYTQRFYRAVAP